MFVERKSYISRVLFIVFISYCVVQAEKQMAIEELSTADHVYQVDFYFY